MHWDQLDWKLIMSIYAAVVSTFVAIWRIHEFIDDKKGRININILVRSWPITYRKSDQDKEEMLTALITNVGKKPRYVSHPYYLTKPLLLLEEEGIKYNDLFKDQIELRLLQPGEQFKFEIPIWVLCKYKKAGASAVRVSIHDTHDKFYTSKWEKL